MSAERNVCLVTSMPFSRICVKALFNAPVSTHSDMVPPLADCLPIQMQIMNRMARSIQILFRNNKITFYISKQQEQYCYVVIT